MIVTQHFQTSEFGCKDGTPYPPDWFTERLRPLCRVLEELRYDLNAPIIITSGYRTPEYNTKIGGAPRSQHVQGRAADIQVKSYTPAQVHETILRLHGIGKVRLGGLGVYNTFVHLDIRDGDKLAQWSGKNVVDGEA